MILVKRLHSYFGKKHDFFTSAILKLITLMSPKLLLIKGFIMVNEKLTIN